MLTVENHQAVADRLLENKALTKQQLEEAKKAVENTSKPLLAYLAEKNIVTNEQLTKASAQASNIPYVNLTEADIKPATLKLVSKEIAEHYMAVPLGEMKGRLVVAMLDANNVQAADYLSSKIGRPITVYAASEDGLRHILDQYPNELHSDVVNQAITGIADSKKQRADAKSKRTGKAGTAEDVQTFVQDSPISRALTAILEYAANSEASDIHIEPREDELVIRIRVDGILREIMKLPKSIEPALISRVKILSNLKIDEHRVPQDGQFQVTVGTHDIDLRISISPVVWGEQVVIRLLDKDGKVLKLEDLGFRGMALKNIREGIQKPHGMILSSGPTGSGKSTTLYALLNEIKSDKINIVTLEDPVEYKMDGVNQIQVNPDVGLTFASGLRSVLRQDPDVVMVGEIRDHETASLAVQAALTGHLVLSTLHTNSAAGVLPRLLDMQIEPYLIASTVNTVIGQRLVRRVASNKEERQSTDAETLSIKETLKNVLPKTHDQLTKKRKEWVGQKNLPALDQNAYTLYEGKDSQTSPGGYKGRVGIYEVFSVSEQIEHMLINHATSTQIQHQAQKEGMLTMKQDGFVKALNGLTTLTEVGRVASDN